MTSYTPSHPTPQRKAPDDCDDPTARVPSGGPAAAPGPAPGGLHQRRRRGRRRLHGRRRLVRERGRLRGPGRRHRADRRHDHPRLQRTALGPDGRCRSSWPSSGYKARIAQANADGGVDGVEIELSYKDDAFQPDKAKANVTEFIEKRRRRHPQHLRLRSARARSPTTRTPRACRCCTRARPLRVLRHRNYPWTVQFLPSADRETRFVADLIKAEHPGDDLKVGVAINETASGADEAETFRASAEDAGIDVVARRPRTPIPTAAATKLTTAGVNVALPRRRTWHLRRPGHRDGPRRLQARARRQGQQLRQRGGVPRRRRRRRRRRAVPSSTSRSRRPGVRRRRGREGVPAHDLGDDAEPNNTITVNGWLQADLLVKTLRRPPSPRTA